MELRYLPSTLEYFFPLQKERRLLDANELGYLKSVESITIDDPELLDTLANDVERTVFRSRITRGHVRIHDAVKITCYKDGEQMMSLIARWADIHTDTGEHFISDGSDGVLSIMQEFVPEVRPFALRVHCAKNLWFLHHYIWRHFKSTKEYPSPEAWCDVLMRVYLASHTDRRIDRWFACPSAEGGRCHYAMNPDCTPTSPPDTVLLFETTGGWNQHGGPELFVFDNHDPRGGCVMLNDADLCGLRGPTVLFVRTREEFQQLRWK